MCLYVWGLTNARTGKVINLKQVLIYAFKIFYICTAFGIRMPR